MKTLIVHSSKNGNTRKLAKWIFIAKAQAKDPQPDWIADASSAVGHPAGFDMNMLLKELGDAIR